MSSRTSPAAPAPAVPPSAASARPVQTMDPGLIERFGDQRVPRYTSYPTSPHFTPAVDGATYRAWLSALDPAAPVSLYLHVPFCRTICWYCGCHTQAAPRAEPVDRYVAALADEIALVASCLPARLNVRALHWGGGTPTIVGPDAFARIMARIGSAFAVQPGAEIAVEVDPRRLDAAMVQAMARAGVNRASLGVQSFDPKVQQAIGRVQGVDATRAAAHLLRAAGIGRLNVDLVYGLPHQTAAACAETVAAVLDLDPDRVALFGYAHMPALRRHQRAIDPATLPGGAERLTQFETVAAALVAAGYCRIGLDHFAKPGDDLALAASSGRLHRNFQGYVADPPGTLIGFGASAIGALPQGYVQTIVDIEAWRRAVAAGALPVARGRALDAEDRLRAAVIERIMCDLRVDLAAEARRHGANPGIFAHERPALQRFAESGVVRLAGDVVEVAEPCRPLVRSVAALFDAYLPGSGERHSRSV